MATKRRVTRHIDFETTTPGPKKMATTATDTAPTSAVAPAAVLDTNPWSEGRDQTSIKVFLRIRPFNDDERHRNAVSCILPSQHREHVLKLRPKNADAHPPTIRNSGRAAFRFETIFDQDISQATIFKTIALPLISGLFDGKNSVAFAYGVTCSGKTFTIQGNPQCPGILPRSLDVIFNSISKAKGLGLAQDKAVSAEVARLTDEVHHTRRLRPRTAISEHDARHDDHFIPVSPENDYSILASYLEVYNEQVYDLFVKPSGLDDSAASQHGSDNVDRGVGQGGEDTVNMPAARFRRPALKLKERAGEVTGIRDVYADGQTQVQVRSVADIDRLLEFGCNNRSAAHTKSNSNSSRSHAIFSITLKQEHPAQNATNKGKPARQTPARLTESRLYIVDLAGSEKISKGESSIHRVFESRQINTSLMTLSRCLDAMRYNQRVALLDPAVAAATKRKGRIIPFRDSKLTRLLQHSLLVGTAVMIATMSPCLEDADETIHTLRNTAIAREVKLRPTRTALSELTNTNNICNNKRPPPRPKGPLSHTLKLGVIGKAPGRVLRPKQDAENVLVENRIKHASELEAMRKTVALLHQQVDTKIDEVSFINDRSSRLEEALKLSERARGENDDKCEQLYRENERLRARLAHVESKVRLTEIETREAVSLEAKAAMKDMAEAYEAKCEILRNKVQEHDRRKEVLMTENERQVRAERMSRRLARTSCAALESIANDFQRFDDEDNEIDELSEQGEESFEEGEEDTTEYEE